ncbi:MAG: threonine synthase [Gemmatimonadaceae bacterium]|jgi:threonine synthase|nr:threonine synthase [Gemmatimonadaceae bacterium]
MSTTPTIAPHWRLACSECGQPADPAQPQTLCTACSRPLFAQVDIPRDRAGAIDPSARGLWRYRRVLPVLPGEPVVSIGEGWTPMLEAPALARALGLGRLWVKDEAQNPTASFKARGMALAVTRARALGLPGLTVPTAGNAGAALAAYAAAAGMPVRIWAPRTTPPPILDTIDAFGATLTLVDGHIGDAGREARAWAAEHGWFDVSTLREPYRVEGMKTMGYEMAEQLGWRLPTAFVYPTGGGEGTVGIWKAIHEMQGAGWLAADLPRPRVIVAQAAGCAPLVRAHDAGAAAATLWEDPHTYASGLRVPGPLGDRFLLAAMRESQGAAVAVTDATMREATRRLAAATGVDAAPEGGCALAALEVLVARGGLGAADEVVLFNTGAGASYRWRPV